MLREIDTPRGPALVQLDRPGGVSLSLLVLGHGAGGGVESPDLVALRDAAVAAGVTVARMTQPYRVAGRRAPAPAGHLDEAWMAVVHVLRREVSTPALIVGGRSSGARVACRTASGVGAGGVVALAFPLQPPARRGKPDTPPQTRAAELASGVPTLVVNGDRDPFGVPDPMPNVRVEVRPGERHELRRDPAGTATVVVRWLAECGWARS